MPGNIRSGRYDWETEDKLQPAIIITGQQTPNGALTASIGSIFQEEELREESLGNLLCSTDQWQSPRASTSPPAHPTLLAPTHFFLNVILKAILIFFFC